MTTLRVKFEDVDLQPVYIPSTWKVVEEGARKSTKSQTTPELWQFQETEMQTGIYTDIVQDQVSEKYSGMPLLTHYRKKHKNKTEAEWRTAIEDGYVTVDCEVVTDVQAKVEKDFFLEYVDLKTNIGTQTKSGKEDSKEADEVTFDDQSVADFLQKVTPAVLKELDSGSTTRAFDMMNMSSTDDALEEISYWKVLSVDLEKKKVIFPDWTKATHYHGTIIKCTVTRNKERIYDVEYEDGTRLNGVREEYIRLLSDVPSSNKRNQNTTSIVSRLQEGVRVHAKVTMKGGYVKFLPGRVSKVVRSGIYDVECEGSRMEMGLTSDDLRIGLEERQKVEARRPNKVILQCTGTSWNATGNMIAVSYGRNDIIGWCDFPGAVCCWNVFSKAFNPHSPDFVLDHAASLMCVKYHPQSPALVVAGSFNGEVIVWDLTTPEQPLAISAIVEYAHKEPVMDVSWVYDSYKSEWMIASVGADGKLLFWSLKNGLEHPVKGATLSKGRSKK